MATKQTPDEADERQRILALAEAKGVSRRDLARMAGLPQTSTGEMRITRWARGEGRLEPGQTDAMLSGLSAVEDVASGGHGDPESQDDLTTEAILQRAAELRALAGEPPEDTPDNAELVALAKLHRRAAMGVLVKLAVSARSETTRLKAATELLDRADGRPTQTVRDLTERAPVEDAELLDMLSRLIAQKLISRVAGAEPATLDTIVAESAGLPEDHADAVARAVTERRKALLAAVAAAGDGAVAVAGGGATTGGGVDGA